MKVLIVDDDASIRATLSALLHVWGYEVIEAPDGEEAWRILEGDSTLQVILTDWMMPRMDGLELCRRVKTRANGGPNTYLILLTVRGDRSDVVQALEAGADEFLSKPITPNELRSRLKVAIRILSYEKALSEKIKELEKALAEIKQLGGLLPICASCHKIRDDKGYWNRLEKFIQDRSNAEFTHSLCPDCTKKLYPGLGDDGPPLTPAP